MAYVVSHEGSVQLTSEQLASGEDWLLCLYQSAKTPAEADVAADYTAIEADFTNYARKTLTRSVSGTTWSTPVSQAPSGSPPWSARSQVASSSYGAAAQSWTCGATGNTVYGYFILGATSGKLIMAEAFATARTLASGDSMAMTPIYEDG